jgi:exosortase/archaeosortase family protein
MITRALRHPMFLVAVAVAACWAAWTWYVTRLIHVPSQRSALVPLVLAIVLSRFPAPTRRAAPGIVPLVAGLAAYSAAWLFVPPLLRALLAFLVFGLALGVATGGAGIRPGVVLLLALALPLIPTAQFYLGYPLRAVSGEASAWMLAASGFDVVRSGTVLEWNGSYVAVDGACSGVRMLWTGLLVAGVVAAARDLRWTRTIVLCAIAILAVMAGNVMRTSALFFVETRLVVLPAWGHQGVGLVCFGLTLLLIGLGARCRLVARKSCPAV